MTTPTLHTQALARIEEEISDSQLAIDHLVEMKPYLHADIAIPRHRRNLSAWQTLKAVLEKSPNPTDESNAKWGSEINADHRSGYQHATNDFRNLIISGVLGG